MLLARGSIAFHSQLVLNCCECTYSNCIEFYRICAVSRGVFSLECPLRQGPNNSVHIAEVSFGERVSIACPLSSVLWWHITWPIRACTARVGHVMPSTILALDEGFNIQTWCLDVQPQIAQGTTEAKIALEVPPYQWLCIMCNSYHVL